MSMSQSSRRAGVNIPLFSIRTAHQWGVGEIADLVPFAAWAKRAGFSTIQLLPVNEPSHGQNSPYMARSAFAIDPAYLSMESIEDFKDAGGVAALSPEMRRTLDEARAQKEVRWDLVRRVKDAALALAFNRFHSNVWKKGGARDQAFNAFCERERGWQYEYALFSAIADSQSGHSWQIWPDALRNRQPEALKEAAAKHADRILYYQYVQWLLDEEWRAARAGAEKLGVSLMGDLPFMVSTDSSDVWSRSREFRFDATIGVPPDAFSAEGQNWGLPVFRWDVMRTNDYEWMRLRAARAAEQFGLYRIDHVVGLYRTYFITTDKTQKGFIPDGEPAQIAQGERLIEILRDGGGAMLSGDKVIAEDLGTVPPFVRASLTRLGVPGYRVLRWEKDDHVFRDPAKWPALSVATTGTHDTESLAEWYDALPAWERKHFLSLPGLEGLRESGSRFDDHARDALLELVQRSGSSLSLVPFQDAMGSRERVNLPGSVADTNWSYRMAQTVDALAADTETTERLRAIAHRGGRA